MHHIDATKVRTYENDICAFAEDLYHPSWSIYPGWNSKNLTLLEQDWSA